MGERRNSTKSPEPYLVRHGRRAGRPPSRPRLHRIAYTETVRGINDEQPTILFLGAPRELLQDVGTALCRMMADNIRDITVTMEHAIVFRNGKGYWRQAVGIIGLNEEFISYAEFVKFFVHKMTTMAHCKVRHYKLDVFLNL